MEIDLKGYYKLIKQRLWIVIGCIILFTLPTSILAKDTYIPIYQASTELMVTSSTEIIDYNALSVIIRTPIVLDKVVEWYPDLRMTSEQIGSAITVAAENGSQVLRIRALDSDHSKAVKIVNSVSQVVKAAVPQAMNVDEVTILNPAKETSNPVPINPKSHKYIVMLVLSLFGAVIVAVGIIFFLDILDDTLKTEEDIRSIFGKSTLAVIPKMTDTKKIWFRKRRSAKHSKEDTYAASGS